MSLRLKLTVSIGLILLIWFLSGYYILNHLNQLGRLQASLPENDIKKNGMIRLIQERMQSMRALLILHNNVSSVPEDDQNSRKLSAMVSEIILYMDSLRVVSDRSRAILDSLQFNWFDRFLFDAAGKTEMIEPYTGDSPVSSGESEQLKRMAVATDSLFSAKEVYLKQLRQKQPTMAASVLKKRMNPLFDEIHRSAEQAGSISTAQATHKLGMIHQMTVQIKIMIYGFWTVTLLFILAFIYYYFRKIIRSIGRLKEASYRIARGEFETRIEQKSFAEMDDLSQSFNAMAEQLQELEKLKSDFFNKLVHDFKSPLDNIKQSADVLLSDMAGGTLNPKQKEFLEIIRRSAGNLRNFVQDQLEESKLISGQMELKYEPTDIRALMTERIQLQKPVATARRIHFNLKYTPTPLVIDCDRVKISRVMDNLLNNAIKFSSESTSVDIELDESETLIECRIKDHGSGIPHTQKERIFQKYIRLTTPVKMPGTGLGLYTAKYIIQLHHGTIWVDSKVGRGSTFAFSLPKKIPGTNRQ